MPLFKGKEVPLCKCPSRAAEKCCDCGKAEVKKGRGFTIRREKELHSLCRDCVALAEHDDEDKEEEEDEDEECPECGESGSDCTCGEAEPGDGELLPDDPSVL